VITRLSRWLGSSVLAAMLVLSACGSGHVPNRAPTASGSLRATPSAAPSADPQVEVRAALAAYTSMLNAYVAASNAGSDDTSELARYATGSALRVLSQGLADNKAKGLHTQGSPTSGPVRVTAVAPVSDPTSVSVSGCLDDSWWLVYRADGQLVNDAPGGRRQATAEVRKTGGVWKVDSFGIRGVGTCT
jgi:hypothetical protein